MIGFKKDFKMKVLSLSYEDINELHQLTDCEFFKDDGNGNFLDGSLAKQGGKTIFSSEKIESHFPKIDLSKYTEVDYVAASDGDL